jgi:hypothetical protein
MSPHISPIDALHHLQSLSGGTIKVFTLPSHPAANDKVCFIAEVSGFADLARLDILINGTRVATSSDAETRFYGGPYAGTVVYQAIAYDKAGRSVVSEQRVFATTGVVDTQPPAAQVVASPPQAATGEQVVFAAHAQDAGGLVRLELWVSGNLVQSSTQGHCSYVGGPFPPGSVAYWAIAYDQAGNRAIAGPYHLEVGASPQETSSGISGRLTGQRQLAAGVRAYNLDQPDQTFSTEAGAAGQYALAGLPNGRYRVRPFPHGKVELIAEPQARDVECHGQQLQGIDFLIVRIEEG